MSSGLVSHPPVVTLWNIRVTPRANILLCFMALLLSVALHYPGHVDFDGIVVWYEARHAVHFSSHPPAMSLLLRYLD